MSRSRLLGSARYRVAQFGQALWATVAPIDEAYVRQQLSVAAEPAALFRLFHEMPRVERFHGVRTCRALERQGFTDPELLIAALLHDAGKGLTPPKLWERVLVVLVERFLPRLAVRWRESGSVHGALRGPRRGFVVRRYHAHWGATLAAEAGAPIRAVSLIRDHHSAAGEDRQLAALQEADAAA